MSCIIRTTNQDGYLIFDHEKNCSWPLADVFSITPSPTSRYSQVQQTLQLLIMERVFFDAIFTSLQSIGSRFQLQESSLPPSFQVLQSLEQQVQFECADEASAELFMLACKVARCCDCTDAFPEQMKTVKALLKELTDLSKTHQTELQVVDAIDTNLSFALARTHISESIAMVSKICLLAKKTLQSNPQLSFSPILRQALDEKESFERKRAFLKEKTARQLFQSEDSTLIAKTFSEDNSLKASYVAAMITCCKRYGSQELPARIGQFAFAIERLNRLMSSQKDSSQSRFFIDARGPIKPKSVWPTLIAAYKKTV